MLALETSKQTVERFAFSADGRYLAVAGSGRKVHLWDLTAKKLGARVYPSSGRLWKTTRASAPQSLLAVP